MTFPQIFHFVLFQVARFAVPPQVLAEWILVFVCLLLIFYQPFGELRWVAVLRDRFVRFSHKKRACILVCGVLPVAFRLAMLGITPVPLPSIHDEFSHLLLGDTLAHGRLTNPPHRFWQNFESIHVIQQPTYNSMYPPAQGAVLALGKLIFGYPWAGVLLAVGTMFAAFCWMMQGWLPAPWAFYGTLLAMLKIGFTGLWIDSYLPAAVPSLAGALVIGALPRLTSAGFRTLHSILFGLGIVILMQSRPFEGAVLTFAALSYLAIDWFRKQPRDTRKVLMVARPAAVVLALGFVFTGYYSYRVTGNPLRMPYQVNRDTYGWPENLGFLPAKKLQLRDTVLQAMYIKEVNHREIYQSVSRFLDDLGVRSYDNWTVLIGPLLTVPLVFLPLIAMDPAMRALVLFLLLAALLNLFQMVLYPYHLAAVIPALYAVIAEGLHRLYLAWGAVKPSRSRYLAVLFPACLLIIGVMKQQADGLQLPLAYWERAAEPHRDARASIAEFLLLRPGKQLVMVRYLPGHPVNQEWVYNGADLDGSKVIWAREVSPEQDAELLEYYRDREIWLLKADELPQRVVPYLR